MPASQATLPTDAKPFHSRLLAGYLPPRPRHMTRRVAYWDWTNEPQPVRLRPPMPPNPVAVVTTETKAAWNRGEIELWGKTITFPGYSVKSGCLVPVARRTEHGSGDRRASLP